MAATSPGGAADLGPYLKTISWGCFKCVPSFMLLTQNAQFDSNIAHNSPTNAKKEVNKVKFGEADAENGSYLQ